MKSLVLAAVVGLCLVSMLGSASGAARYGKPVGVAAARCPGIAPKGLWTGNPSARRVLVPAGSSALLLCRYRGLNPTATAHHLEGTRLIASGSKRKRLTAALDALPEPHGVMACPFDDDSEITATFRYPDAGAVRIEVGLRGCQLVRNARLTRIARGQAGARLISQLEALVP